MHRRTDRATVCLRNHAETDQTIYELYSDYGLNSQILSHSIDRLRSIEDGIVFQDGRKIGRLIFRPELFHGYSYTLLYVLPIDFVLELYTETHFLLDEETLVEMKTDRRIRLPMVAHPIDCTLVDQSFYLICRNFIYRLDLSFFRLTSVSWPEEVPLEGLLIDNDFLMLAEVDAQTYRLRSIAQTDRLLRTITLPDSPSNFRCYRTNGRYYLVGEQPLGRTGSRYTFYG